MTKKYVCTLKYVGGIAPVANCYFLFDRHRFKKIFLECCAQEPLKAVCVEDDSSAKKERSFVVGTLKDEMACGVYNLNSHFFRMYTSQFAFSSLFYFCWTESMISVISNYPTTEHHH